MLKFAAVLCTAMMASGCLQGHSECGDLVCPPKTECAAAVGVCVLPEQLEPCRGVADDEPCNLGATTGSCRNGVCLLPSCGDGVRVNPERCDGADLDDKTCLDMGYYSPDGLACDDNCELDLSECKDVCGDGEVNGLEDCEAGVLGDRSCLDYGFYNPDGLVCGGGCNADTTGCTERCGDNLVNGPELCDGTVAVGLGCADVGHDYGTLPCAACVADLSRCQRVLWLSEPRADVIEAMWPLPSGEVLGVVGPRVYRWDGAEWTVLHEAPAGDLFLHDVWASGPDDIFAVGNGPAATGLHWNGATWTILQAPGGLLKAVAGSNGRVFGVSQGGGISEFDGIDRFVSIAGTPSPMLDVWMGGGVGFAVGGSVVWQFNGTSWSPLTAQPVVASGRSLEAVWATAANDVMVYDTQLIHHWNGSTWATTQSGVAAGSAARFAGDPASSLVMLAAGEFANQKGLLVRDRRGWWPISTGPSTQQVALAATGTGQGALLASFESGDVATGELAAGYRTTLLTAGLNDFWLSADGSTGMAVGLVTLNRGAAARFVGASFTTSPISPTLDALHAVWGAAVDQIFAVGEAGTIDVWNGTAWSKVTPEPTTATLRGVGGTSATHVLAVGDSGTIVRLTAGTWVTMTSGTTQRLNDVVAPSATEAWAVGDAGTILRSDGTSWMPVSSGVTVNLHGVWRAPTGEIYVAGDDGTILMAAVGGAFTTMRSGFGVAFDDIEGTAANDVFAVSSSGLVVHWDGDGWAPVRLTTDTTFRPRSVHAAGAFTYFASGARVHFLVRP